MRKEYVFISLIIVIVGVKLFIPTAPDTENAEINPTGDSASGTQSESGNSEKIVVSETNADKLDISSSDLEALTIDEQTGESCNDYIIELLQSGTSSYVISPDNEMSNYFCSQTIGSSSLDDLDLSGYESPALLGDYFSNTSMNSGSTYVGITSYDDDVYLSCFLDTAPDSIDKYNSWDQVNCDFTLIDSHYYFTPKKVLDESTMEFVLTDTEYKGHLLSEYYDELGRIPMWYGERDYYSPEQFVQNTPTKDELDFSIVDYEAVSRALTALQESVSQDYSVSS